MAELRRDAGSLEPRRGAQYRVALLPWEQQFCETLGISVEEYFEYYELVAQHVEEEQNRELIPDVRNEPVTIVTLVVGVALSAVGMLLAPKPRAPEQGKKQGDPFQAQNIRGRTKFAPLAEFDSIQDLATLGSIVPLVYTRRQDGHGGVRAESQLLWSRMRNNTTYQELRALLLFSAGEIDVIPDYKGYAFGDSKLNGYSAPKISLWFNPGLAKGDGNKPFANQDNFQYDEGTRQTGRAGQKPFFTNLPDDGRGSLMIFCGTITPSSSSVFGQYSPVRNGHGWKYDFKYPGKGDGDIERKEIILGTRRKHVTGYHAGRTTTEINGTQLKYKIYDRESDKIFQACARDASTPDLRTKDHFKRNGELDKISEISQSFSGLDDIGGMDEGLTAIDQSRIDADTTLDVGEMYLIGSDIYVCEQRINEEGDQGTPFAPKESGNVVYTFRREGEFFRNYVENKYIEVGDSEDIFNEQHQPIQKVAIGSISTTRAVEAVEIGFKSVVYRRVNGYPNINQFSYEGIANDYAKELQTWQPGNVNAYYDRIALFRLEIKRGNTDWRDWSGEELFAVYGNNPQPQYNQIMIKVPDKNFYEFRFIPVSGNAWLANGNAQSKRVYLLNARMDYTLAANKNQYQVYIKGERLDSIDDYYRLAHKYWAFGVSGRPNQNPNSLLNDFWYFDADEVSHESDPEHSITWMNEYVENSNYWYNNESEQYQHLAHAGLICRSSTEISTFSNFSAYFRHGIKVERLLGQNDELDSTNNFPEIAFDLLTNRRYGVGEFIGRNAIDEEMFTEAAKFCNANGFYWDGVISSNENVREFLYQQAAYQLLDFTIIGGRFSLFPAVPYGDDYKIDFNAKAGGKDMPIKALFTNGNVRSFKTTFLSPEERQLFIAECKYRIEDANGFPETHLVRVRLAGTEGGYDKDPVESFDMTQFCTTREHAVAFAKYALRTRQIVDHSVSFETTPDACHSLSPGDYIRVAVSIQHQERDKGYTERLRTGSVAPNGTVQINNNEGMTDRADVLVYWWKPGFTEVREGTLKIRDGVSKDPAMRGILFTRQRVRSETRVYKIESIAYSEDSFVEISGSYQPLDEEQKLRVLAWDDKDFVIEDQRA